MVYQFLTLETIVYGGRDNMKHNNKSTSKNKQNKGDLISVAPFYIDRKKRMQFPPSPRCLSPHRKNALPTYSMCSLLNETQPATNSLCRSFEQELKSSVNLKTATATKDFNEIHTQMFKSKLFNLLEQYYQTIERENQKLVDKVEQQRLEQIQSIAIAIEKMISDNRKVYNKLRKEKEINKQIISQFKESRKNYNSKYQSHQSPASSESPRQTVKSMKRQLLPKQMELKTKTKYSNMQASEVVKETPVSTHSPIEQSSNRPIIKIMVEKSKKSPRKKEVAFDEKMHHGRKSDAEVFYRKQLVSSTSADPYKSTLIIPKYRNDKPSKRSKDFNLRFVEEREEKEEQGSESKNIQKRVNRSYIPLSSRQSVSNLKILKGLPQHSSNISANGSPKNNKINEKQKENEVKETIEEVEKENNNGNSVDENNKQVARKPERTKTNKARGINYKKIINKLLRGGQHENMQSFNIRHKKTRATQMKKKNKLIHEDTTQLQIPNDEKKDEEAAQKPVIEQNPTPYRQSEFNKSYDEGRDSQEEDSMPPQIQRKNQQRRSSIKMSKYEEARKNFNKNYIKQIEKVKGRGHSLFHKSQRKIKNKNSEMEEVRRRDANLGTMIYQPKEEGKEDEKQDDQEEINHQDIISLLSYQGQPFSTTSLRLLPRFEEFDLCEVKANITMYLKQMLDYSSKAKELYSFLMFMEESRKMVLEEQEMHTSLDQLKIHQDEESIQKLMGQIKPKVDDYEGCQNIYRDFQWSEKDLSLNKTLRFVKFDNGELEFIDELDKDRNQFNVLGQNSLREICQLTSE